MSMTPNCSVVFLIVLGTAFLGGCDKEQAGTSAPAGGAGAASSAAGQLPPAAEGVSEQSFAKLTEGMSEVEVEAILGPSSTSVSKPRSRTRKLWRATVQQDGRPLDVEVQVSFKDGKLASKKVAPAAAAPTTAPGRPFGSPDAVFTAFDAALTNEDWATAFRCLAPQSQEVAIVELLSGMSYVQATRGKGYPPELKEILTRYGVTSHGHGSANVEVVAPEAIRRVREKEALFVETLDLMDEMFNNQPRAGAVLRDVNASGDEATGLISKVVGNATSSGWKIRFRQEGGGWLLEFEQKPRLVNFLDWRLGWRL